MKLLSLFALVILVSADEPSGSSYPSAAPSNKPSGSSLPSLTPSFIPSDVPSLSGSGLLKGGMKAGMPKADKKGKVERGMTMLKGIKGRG